jgi:hypothetical protein
MELYDGVVGIDEAALNQIARSAYQAATVVITLHNVGVTTIQTSNGKPLLAMPGGRTPLQGIAAALPAVGAGTVVLGTTHWHAFGYSCLAALIAAAVAFLQNAAATLPEDPTRQSGHFRRREFFPSTAPNRMRSPGRHSR